MNTILIKRLSLIPSRKCLSLPPVRWCLSLLFLAALPAGLEAAYGDLLWSNPTDGIIFGAPAIGPGGEVVVGSEDGNIYSFNPDGSLRWVFTGATDWVDSSPTIAPDGTVYAGSWDNFLYAIDGMEGSLKWKFETGGMIIGSPALGPDGTIIVGSNDSFLYAIRPDGTERWISEPVDSFSPINSSPVINRAGDTLYFGNDSGEFFAVDIASGQGLWYFDTQAIHPADSETDYAIVGSAAIDGNGNLYFGSENGYLYALSAQGDLRWAYDAVEPIRASPAISADGTLYFPGQDGYLYALDSEGFQLWESFVGDVFYCSPAIDADGNILIGAYAGSAALGAATAFLSLDQDGFVIWEYLIFGYNDSSPNIAPDGSIYFGAHDGYLYKFEGAGPLMDGQWPRFQANRRQTGFHQTHPPLELIDLFPGISRLEDGWALVPWFGDGWVHDAGLPWIRHSDHGFIYAGAAARDSLLFYDPGLDSWLQASAEAIDYLYVFASASWIYHVWGTTAESGRWFYDIPEQAWFTDRP